MPRHDRVGPIAWSYPSEWAPLAEGRDATIKVLCAVGFGVSSGSQFTQRTAWAEFTNQDVERVVIVPVGISVVINAQKITRSIQVSISRINSRRCAMDERYLL